MKRVILVLCTTLFVVFSVFAAYQVICSKVVYNNSTPQSCSFDLDTRDSIKIQCLNNGDGVTIHSFPRIVITQGGGTLLDETFDVSGNGLNVFYRTIVPDPAGTETGIVTITWTIPGGATSVNVDIYKQAF